MNERGELFCENASLLFWAALGTNFFDTSGNFIFTNAISPTDKRRLTKATNRN